MTQPNSDSLLNSKFPPNNGYTSTSRPGSVIGAAVVLIVFGLIGLLANARRAGHLAAVPSDGFEAVGYLSAILIGGIASLVAIAAGIWLLTSRSSSGRVFAVIAAAALAFTCFGIVATFAVPILLYTPDSAKRWFAVDPAPPTSS